MRPIVVRLEFNPGSRFWRGAGALALLAVCVGTLESESVSLTTYYPAPSGIYTRMITTGHTHLARDSGRVGIGTSSPVNKLSVNGSADIVNDLTVSGRMGVATSPTGQALTVNGTGGFTGRLGVGTAAPTTALDVNGGPSRNLQGGCAEVHYSFDGITNCPPNTYATWMSGYWAATQLQAGPGTIDGAMLCCPR